MHRSVRLCYFRKPDIRLVTQPWKELKLGTKESKRKRGPCRKPKEIGSSAMKFWEESILRMPSVLKCWQRENKVPRVIFPPPPLFFSGNCWPGCWCSIAFSHQGTNCLMTLGLHTLDKFFRNFFRKISFFYTEGIRRQQFNFVKRFSVVALCVRD